MPAYLNDDELFFALRECHKLEELADRLSQRADTSAPDAARLKACAAGVRFLLERAEARGKVH